MPSERADPSLETSRFYSAAFNQASEEARRVLRERGLSEHQIDVEINIKRRDLGELLAADRPVHVEAMPPLPGDEGSLCYTPSRH